jgi:CRISPR/Cas system Type II protein with McrA/HNH and RuvC-like nuclease domain
MSQHHTSNWIRRDKRLAIYLRDDCTCAYCGITVKVGDSGADAATLDHVQPASKGGSNRADNLVVACKSCNSSRQDSPMAVFCRSKGMSEREAMATIRRIRRQRTLDLAPFREQAKAILADTDNTNTAAL